MKLSWRWYGPNDPVSLADIRQAGATSIVSALHHVPNGEVWTVEDIQQRQAEIRAASTPGFEMEWDVVESVPVHEAIKRGLPERSQYIENYCQSLKNLAACGIEVVCYNFMPILDWTRTDLAWSFGDGSKALRYDAGEFAAFDLFILERAGAEADYSPEEIAHAKVVLEHLTPEDQQRLARNIIAGLPGAEESYTLEAFREELAAYREIGADQLRQNLIAFLEAIVPVATSSGIRLCIHPDDPPFPLLGLPRVVSTSSDLAAIYSAVPDIANGLTFCTGSFGVRPDNNLTDMIQAFGDRIHFVHLRSTKREPDGSFHEADHLAGDVDMVAVIDALLKQEALRTSSGRSDAQIPMRPDHGHQMLDDLQKNPNPGYSAIGRLRGLAELRGIQTALSHNLYHSIG
ncbi:mannonate dehydratase [Pontibacter sp. G13]|uniref:mannonate dehydratase n=1 Tax=Pontibacter sp. G13 TaxID=3074898 RepID=UPI0039064DEC